MPSNDPHRRHLVAQVGAQQRHNPGSDRLEDARRSLKEDQLRAAIEKAVDEAPELTEMQKLRLAALLMVSR